MQEFTFRPLEDGNVAVMGYEGDEMDIVIPEEYGGKITILGDKLFAGHPEIRSVRIPDTVTDMGEFLFDGCSGLKRIDLPKNLNCLWGYTFARCGIEEIVLPDQLKTVPPFAFKGCADLKRVVCGKGLRKIYSWAFAGCGNPELVHSGAVEVSPEAFEDRALNEE